MMADAAQTYKNHAKFVPLYRFVLLPMFTTWAVLMAFAFHRDGAVARVFALKAQGR